jgi:HK97 gp10 family phage protein
LEYKSNKNAILAALLLCKKEFCTGVGTLAVAEVQSVTPVGTDQYDTHKGNLKKSIVAEVMPSNEGVYVGVTPNADYGLWVEKGSSRQSPQPYLEPGCNNAIPKITNIAEQVYRNKMGDK